MRLAVAHGRLSEEELERVMIRFINKEIDMLVCTTIIESGLDIPSANTMLVNRADKFGLAQMYQLRGRVGRSNEQAFAYLFIPRQSSLGRNAQKQTIWRWLQGWIRGGSESRNGGSEDGKERQTGRRKT